MSLKRFGLKVEKIVVNLIKLTNEDKLKWQDAHMMMSGRLCSWSIKLPEDKSGYVGSIELWIMPFFRFLKLEVDGETISRNQKLLRNLLKVIRNQDKRFYTNPRLQHAAATAKQFENPE